MAYVAPNSRAVFYTGTGLTPSYDNSLYFSSETAKDDYFTNLGGFDTSRISYQRENRNFIRIETNIINLYNCDYMRFKNDSFENKWFYAFVMEVNYINNATTEIVYQLDPLMTWMGVFTLNQCYIVRQHTLRDGVGNNISEEGLPVGQYVTEGYKLLWGMSPDSSAARIAIAMTTGGIAEKCGLYSGLISDDCETQSKLSIDLKDYVEQDLGDSILSVTMIPNECVNEDDIITKDVHVSKPYDDFDGYVPRNKKLFCYPYKYCVVENSEGSTMELKYEYSGTTPDTSSSGDMNFRIVLGNYPTGFEALCVPIEYMDNSGYENRLTMTHAPQVAYTVNSYDAYLAQKNAYYKQDLAKLEADYGRAMTVGAITGLAGSELPSQSYSTKNAYQPLIGFGNINVGSYTTEHTSAGNVASNTAMGGLMGALKVASDEWATINNHNIENTVRPITSSTTHGSPAVDVLYSYGLKGFYAYKKCITKNYAMMIDSYFDMFGYYIKQVGTPNMNARPHWTYVKTVGCSLGGNLPASDKKAIESIFDKGTRFWHSLAEMGNYSLDNSPS